MSELHPLVEVSALIALKAPRRPHKGTNGATIPWPLIHELRSVLQRMGYDTFVMTTADKYERKEIAQMLHRQGEEAQAAFASRRNRC